MSAVFSVWILQYLKPFLEYFMFYNSIVNDTIIFTLISHCLLLVCRNTTDFEYRPSILRHFQAYFLILVTFKIDPLRYTLYRHLCSL